MKGTVHGTGRQKRGRLNLDFPLPPAGGGIEIIIRQPGGRKFIKLLNTLAVNKIKKWLGLS